MLRTGALILAVLALSALDWNVAPLASPTRFSIQVEASSASGAETSVLAALDL